MWSPFRGKERTESRGTERKDREKDDEKKTDRQRQKRPSPRVFGEFSLYVILSFYKSQLKGFVYLFSFDGLGMLCESLEYLA